MMEISPQEILESLKYDEAELPTVTLMTLASIEILKQAGAYRESSDLVPLVIISMVGFFMDNREVNYTEYKDVKDFPLGVTSLITVLQYSAPDPVIVVQVLE